MILMKTTRMPKNQTKRCRLDREQPWVARRLAALAAAAAGGGRLGRRHRRHEHAAMPEQSDGGMPLSQSVAARLRTVSHDMNIRTFRVSGCRSLCPRTPHA